MNYDFTKFELDYINENANFNDTQQEIFNRLTDKRGRQSIVQISMEMNISTATVSRVIKQIKHKILKII
jgi:predicted transcriptional regulator